MPVYTYRREDGTTFEYKQPFLDDPLNICPTTGQRVVRIIQKPNVIFKGTGFYVNDSKDASKQSANGGNGNGENGKATTSNEPSSPASTSENTTPAVESSSSNSKSTPAVSSKD